MQMSGMEGPEVTAKAGAALARRGDPTGLALSEASAQAGPAPERPGHEALPTGTGPGARLGLGSYLWKEPCVLGHKWCNQPLCPLEEQAGTASRHWRGKVCLQDPGNLSSITCLLLGRSLPGI